MKVLVTGSLGFLGATTVEKLVNLDKVDSIICAARTERDWRQVDHPKVSYRFGDLSDPEYTRSIVKDCDAIIHTAALSSPWGEFSEFYKSNVSVQKNLINAAKEFGIKRFVNVSTPGVYFELKDKLNVKESDDLPQQFNAYSQTKREAEIVLQESGIPFVSIRPRGLVGKGDTIIMPRLIRAYEEGKLKVVGNGQNVVDMTPVSNVADALILGLFVEGEGINQVYNISNGEPIKLWDKIGIVLKKLGKEPPSKKLPVWLALLAARVMEIKSRLTNGKEPPLTVYGVGTLTKSFTLDISKARELLGYHPAVSIDQSIEEFVEWYKDFEKGKECELSKTMVNLEEDDRVFSDNGETGKLIIAN